ncbi:MAG TPA: RDD family protein [Pseudonocardiaceae bacterium]
MNSPDEGGSRSGAYGGAAGIDLVLRWGEPGTLSRRGLSRIAVPAHDIRGFRRRDRRGRRTRVRPLRGRPWHDASSGAQWDSLAVAGCYFVAGMAVTGRTAGQAVLGLRMVNEVAHGRPGWRAAMIRWAVRQPPQVLLIAVSGSSSVRRALEQLRELQPDVDELRSQHGRSQREFKQSLMDLF